MYQILLQHHPRQSHPQPLYSTFVKAYHHMMIKHCLKIGRKSVFLPNLRQVQPTSGCKSMVEGRALQTDRVGERGSSPLHTTVEEMLPTLIQEGHPLLLWDRYLDVVVVRHPLQPWINHRLHYWEVIKMSSIMLIINPNIEQRWCMLPRSTSNSTSICLASRR